MSAEAHEEGDHANNVRHNFWVLAFFQIVQRIGWIFKTESIIIPAVFDSLGGAGWLRGFLPTLNRLGQSVPPVLLADRIRHAQKKSRAFCLFTGGMSVSFLGVSYLWVTSLTQTSWAAVYFLAMYGVFFVCKGMSDLALGSLQGKLIPATTRGRLLVASNSIGATAAILAAWLLLGHLINAEGGRFHLVFGFSSLCFCSAAIVALMAKEPADAKTYTGKLNRNPFREAKLALQTNRDFRLLAMIGFLFGVSMMLFPHYQALARVRLQLSFDSLVTWVIVQNLGTGVFSLVIGVIADTRGNRLVLRMTLFGIAAMPMLALYLVAHPGIGEKYFAAVFVLFGLTPVTIRILANYALELSSVEEHPRYLSTLTLCVSLPIYFSPLLGLAIDYFDFEWPLRCVSVAVAIAWILCFCITEPRHHDTP